MTSASPVARTSQTSRIAGFDIARAVAVMGMVLVNYRLVMVGDAAAPHWILDVVALFEGRASGLFVVLAGVGLSLLSARARRDGDSAMFATHRRYLLVRATLLFAGGLLFLPLWPADILHFYGGYIALGLLLLGLRARYLYLLSVVFIIAFLVLFVVLEYERGWNWAQLAYTDLWSAPGMVRHYFFNGFHPVVPWSAFLLFGMALGRLNLREVRVRRRLLGWSIVVLIASEMLSRLLLTLFGGALPTEEAQALYGIAPLPPLPLYMISAAASAGMVIALCITLTEMCGAVAYLAPVVASGQLALTLYIAHILLGLGALEAAGLLQNRSAPFAVIAAVIFCTGAILFAHAWRQRFARGPLEWTLRAVEATIVKRITRE